MVQKEDYERVIPERLLRALTSVQAKNRFTLLIALADKEYSYKELIDLGFSTGNLYNHLQDLLKSGLILNYYKKKIGVSNYSYYNISEFGKIFLENLLNTMEISVGLKMIEGTGSNEPLQYFTIIEAPDSNFAKIETEITEFKDSK